MTSGNAAEPAAQTRGSGSGNTGGPARDVLPAELEAALAGYADALRTAPLATATRTKYLSRVRGFLAWVAGAGEPDGPAGTGWFGDVLEDGAGRDGAVRDWRVHAKTVRRMRPATINNTLAAVDDFYRRRGLGAAVARREALPRRAPKALSAREVVRYLRAVEHCGSARDAVVGLLPYYAGLRVGEVAGLDVDDVALSARRGELRIRGKGRDGGKVRDLPLSRPELRTALAAWLGERPSWPGAGSPALLLNRRGGRLSDRSARTVVTALGERAGIGDGPGAGGRGRGRADGFGPHTLRHTFATELLRSGLDAVLVADLLGHAGLGTLAVYTQPTDHDREQALAVLTTDG